MKRAICVCLLVCLLCGCQASETVPETTQPEAFSGICGRTCSHTASGTPYFWAEDTAWPDPVPSFVQGENGELLFGYEDALSPVPGVSLEAPLWLEELGLYASRECSVVVQGNDGGAEVLTTQDGGETWTSAQLDFVGPASWACVGFTSPEDGWVVLCGLAGMGQEVHGLYKTSDGGASWAAVENNIDEVYGRVLTGAGFVSPEIGFLGFRYENQEFEPAVLMTQDGGKTWAKTSVALPEDPEGWNITPLSIGWDGSQYVFPFIYSNDEEEQTVSLYLDAGTLTEVFHIEH